MVLLDLMGGVARSAKEGGHGARAFSADWQARIPDVVDGTDE
jgi:hypothetical protein